MNILQLASFVKTALNGTAGMVLLCLSFPLVASVCIVIGIQSLGDWSFDEVSRVPHPDANIDAVLVETNGGATTSFGYFVYVLPKGRTPEMGKANASFYAAGRSECAYGVNLRWESRERLMVEYLKAQVAEPTEQELTLGGSTISVTLRSGVNDPSAPCGGMLYNLQGRR